MIVIALNAVFSYQQSQEVLAALPELKMAEALIWFKRCKYCELSYRAETQIAKFIQGKTSWVHSSDYYSRFVR